MPRQFLTTTTQYHVSGGKSQCVSPIKPPPAFCQGPQKPAPWSDTSVRSLNRWVGYGMHSILPMQEHFSADLPGMSPTPIDYKIFVSWVTTLCSTLVICLDQILPKSWGRNLTSSDQKLPNPDKTHNPDNTTKIQNVWRCLSVLVSL